MGFELTEELQSLQETLRDFFSSEFPLEKVHTLCTTFPRSPQKELWKKAEELALQQYIEESSDLPFREIALVAQECGRALFPEPLSEALFFGPFLFCHGIQTQEALPELSRITGGISALPTLRGYSETALEVRLGTSDELLVIRAPSSTIYHPRKTIDITLPYISRIEELPTEQIPLKWNAQFSSALLLIIRVHEILGCAEGAFTLTLDYVKTRKQFGVPVGGFQAVQHQLADAYAQLSSLQALASFAAWSVTSSPDQTVFAAQAAGSFAQKAASEIIERCIQVSGGIGFTFEYPLHLFLRRVLATVALQPLLSASDALTALSNSQTL